MSGKPFRFHPEAGEEFREAVRWYRGRNVEVGIEFRIAVSATIREIASAPSRWPTYLHGTRRVVLQRFPFSVVYMDGDQANESEVTIIAIAHAKRKPGYWKLRI